LGITARARKNKNRDDQESKSFLESVRHLCCIWVKSKFPETFFGSRLFESALNSMGGVEKRDPLSIGTDFARRYYGFLC
jgi:hypothetical protein